MVSKKITINRVLNYCNFFIGFVFLNTAGNTATDGFFVDYSGNQEIIQQRIGHNTTLKCSLDGHLDNSKVADITYNWYFKQFGKGSNCVLNCHDTNESEGWTKLPCHDNTCQSELHLKNVTEKYSGLYKCTVMPKLGNILDVKLVRTFQLNIKESFIKIPEFVDAHPINKTISKDSQAVFQCRVYSEEYPTIKWFHRLSNSKYKIYEKIHSTVYDNGRAYELLTSTSEKSTSRNIFLSKLIINDVHLQDEGFYACVAISIRGRNIREAYLKVYAPYNADDFAEYWSDYSEEEDEVLPTDPKEFLSLFLMPVGLALLPFAVWFCYIINKRYRNYSLEDDEEKKVLQENISIKVKNSCG